MLYQQEGNARGTEEQRKASGIRRRDGLGGGNLRWLSKSRVYFPMPHIYLKQELRAQARDIFWISPPRYAQFNIVSGDNHAQSRAPVVEITSVFLWSSTDYFKKCIFWSGSGEISNKNELVGKYSEGSMRYSKILED